MLKLLTDENFHGRIIRGIQQRYPQIDLIRAQDVGLSGKSDPIVLEWAAKHQRIIVTFDRATMPDFAYIRIAQNLTMPGMFVFNDQHSIKEIIEEIILLNSCSRPTDWLNKVIYLPL